MYEYLILILTISNDLRVHTGLRWHNYCHHHPAQSILFLGASRFDAEPREARIIILSHTWIDSNLCSEHWLFHVVEHQVSSPSFSSIQGLLPNLYSFFHVKIWWSDGMDFLMLERPHPHLAATVTSEYVYYTRRHGRNCLERHVLQWHFHSMFLNLPGSNGVPVFPSMPFWKTTRHEQALMQLLSDI